MGDLTSGCQQYIAMTLRLASKAVGLVRRQNPKFAGCPLVEMPGANKESKYINATNFYKLQLLCISCWVAFFIRLTDWGELQMCKYRYEHYRRLPHLKY